MLLVICQKIQKRIIKETLEKIALKTLNLLRLIVLQDLKIILTRVILKLRWTAYQKREIQVLKLFIKGKKNVQISNKLNINQKNC